MRNGAKNNTPASANPREKITTQEGWFFSKKKSLFFKNRDSVCLYTLRCFALFYYNARYFIFNFYSLVLELLYSFPVFPASLVRLTDLFFSSLSYLHSLYSLVRLVVCFFVFEVIKMYIYLHVRRNSSDKRSNRSEFVVQYCEKKLNKFTV